MSLCIFSGAAGLATAPAAVAELAEIAVGLVMMPAAFVPAASPAYCKVKVRPSVTSFSGSQTGGAPGVRSNAR
jgi:hypothetical protein